MSTSNFTGPSPIELERQQRLNALIAVKWIRYHQIEDNHDDSKIMVCGSGQQIHCLLETLESIGDVKSIKRIICSAHCQLATLTESKFWTQYGCRIVSWRQEEYEEDIVRRSRQAAKQKPISTVIDFEPTLRRLHRLFYLVDDCGKILLYQKSQQAVWSRICAPLLPALESRGVAVENLEDDCRHLMEPAASTAATSTSFVVGSDDGEDLAYSSSMSSNEGGTLECDR